MSDPLSNREIEDVLASIRRLVAQEPQSSPAVQGPAARVRTASSGRLVLTPAFRVGTAADTDDSGVLQPDVPSGPAPDGAAPESPDQEPQASAAMSLERTIAELEAAVQASGDDWEPDGSELATVEEAPFVEVDPDSEPPEDNVRMFHLPPNRRQAAIRAEEGAEQAEASQPDEEPATAQQTPDAAQPEVDEPQAETTLFTPAGEETEDTPLLDEAVLREMVTQILREELQGHLGERITRNVRKMVRAEIARALAAKGLT